MIPDMGNIPGLSPRPERWPPEGWPACPDPERYEAALRQHRENMRREGQQTPPALRGVMDEAQFILADEAADMLCAQRAAQDRQTRQFRTMEDHLVFASSLTTEYTIGAAFVRPEGKRGRTQASFGVMPRHPGWAGLCWRLNEAGGMEVLILWNAQHEPDVIIAAPRELLGDDPGRAPMCAAGREAARGGINLTLEEVFRHHQANPHHIDLCSKSGNGLAVLAGLMGKAEDGR